MFTMMMPKDFKLGETREVRINGEPRRLTWADEDTLVIDETDRRRILTSSSSEGGLIIFFCSDAG